MLGRMVRLSFLPRPIALLVLVLGLPAVAAGAFLVGVLSILGAVTTSSGGEVQYQCENAIGPDPSPTETTTFGAGATIDATDVPSTNPPLQTLNTGVAAHCVCTLALAAASDSGDTPTLARQIMYGASLAVSTARCVLPNGQLPAQVQCQQRVGSAAPPSAGVVVLPYSLTGQAGCGQRVDPSAVSPGDLVFWNYVDNAPANEGVAVGPNEMITDADGKYLLAAVPSGSGVRVKRYLTSE